MRKWQRENNGRYQYRARSDGAGVPEHILVAERALGHALPKGAEVHHIDGDGRNNANTNLAIFQNHATHCELHRKMRVKAAGGNPWMDALCCVCHTAKPRGAFYLHRSGRFAGRVATMCRSCKAKYEAARRRREAV